MTQRSFGYVHGTPGIAARVGSAMRARRVPAGFKPTRHPTFVDRWGAPLNQDPTNSCVGFTLAREWELTVGGLTQNAGVTAPKISPGAIYYWARRKAQKRGPLEDSGCYTGDALDVLNDIGPCPDRNFPFRNEKPAVLAERVKAAPPASAVLASKRMRDIYPSVKGKTIVDYGDRLVERILHSLDLGQICGIAIPVGEQFVDGSETLDATPQNDVAGYHEVTLLDWRVVDGEFQLLVGNWWGAWGGTDSPLGTQWSRASLIKQSIHTHYLTGASQ